MIRLNFEKIAWDSIMSCVAVNEEGVCMGYAFCQMQEQPFSTNMVPFKSLFIDDLCVDQQARVQPAGDPIFYGTYHENSVWSITEKFAAKREKRFHKQVT